MIFSTVTILLMMAATPATATAGTRESGPPPAHEPTTTSEIFVSRATMLGIFEVESSKVALSRSKDPAVRDFAQRMVIDHNAIGVELTRIAATKTYHLPVALLLDAEHQKKLKTLRDESDKSFDGAYGSTMIQAHDEAVSVFTKAANETLVDADLRAFANKVLPSLMSHQELARALPTAAKSK